MKNKYLTDMSSAVHAEWTVPRLRALALDRFPTEFRKTLRSRPQILAFLLTREVDLSTPPVVSAVAREAAAASVDAGSGFLDGAYETMRVPQLKEIARHCPGFKSTLKKHDLIALIRAHPAAAATAAAATTAPSPKAPPESFKDLEAAVKKREVSAAALKDMAVAHGWKKEGTKRGNITEYLLFLKDRYGVIQPAPARTEEETAAVVAAVAPVEIQSLADLQSGTWSRVILLENARRKGWPYKNKGTIKELVAYLTKTFTSPLAPVGGGVEESKEEPERRDTPPLLQPADWVTEDIDTIKKLSKKEIKEILKKYHITEALPENKKDLLLLFSKKRCGKTDLRACNTSEVCDLRNELCRDDMAGKSTKLVQYVFQGRRFWGSPEILQDIRHAIVDLEKNNNASAAPAAGEAPITRTTRVVEPVRISNLLEDKEEYLRTMCKAIEATFDLGREAIHVDRPFHPRFQLFQDSNEEIV
jgi:hypothetical protein